MSDLHPSIVRFEGKKIHGLLAAGVTMADPGPACAALWKKLIGMVPLKGLEVYGISLNMGPQVFDYFAGAPLAKAASLPENLLVQDIPAGMYARCPIPNMEEMRAAYTLLYQENWAAGHTEYTVNMLRPCFELYPADYAGGLFYVFAPVDEK